MSQVSRSMLASDIGSTHARFAVVDISRSDPSPTHGLLDLDSSFERLRQALKTYFTRAGLAKTPSAAAIAVGAPVTAGAAHIHAAKHAILLLPRTQYRKGSAHELHNDR
jgi:glucokinase